MELIPLKDSQRIKTKSAIITITFALLLLLISLVWTFVQTTDPPLFEVLSEGSGGVDFGNWVEGSGDINNFKNPSPNPEEGKNAENERVTSSINDEQTPLSGQSEESEVTSPPVKEEKEIKKKDKNLTTSEKQKEIVKNANSNSQAHSTNSHSSGSNHGNSDQVGNRGRDDVKILDNEGLYAFGSGDEGLKGRRPISLPKPVYEVEAEAKITYEFTIAPDGSVKNVKAVTLGSNAELKNAGIKAIYKWKFEPIEENKFQKTKVTITFKLK